MNTIENKLIQQCREFSVSLNNLINEAYTELATEQLETKNYLNSVEFQNILNNAINDLNSFCSAISELNYNTFESKKDI